MLYIYDILVNFTDGDRIYEFFEWDSRDVVEHIKKIPLIRVDTETLIDIYNNDVVVEIELLKDIYLKTEVYNNDYHQVVEYACLLSDNMKVLAVEFDSYGNTLYKSNLLVDEEEEVLTLGNGIKIRSIKYQIKNSQKEDIYLTRKEMSRKKYLLTELKKCFSNKNYQKLNYLYEELYNDDNNSIEEKYNKLVYEINNNYSSNHNEIYNILRLSNKKKTTSN